METVSENEISDPTTAQHRTVPWRPHNVSFDMNQIGKIYPMHVGRKIMKISLIFNIILFVFDFGKKGLKFNFRNQNINFYVLKSPPD